jgi:TonB family protein
MLLFLLKLTLCWSFFALLYALMLSRETFFKANRVYLLATAFFALLLSLFAHQAVFPFNEMGLPVFNLPAVAVGIQKVDAIKVNRTWMDYLWILYIFGCVLAFVRFATGLIYLFLITRKGRASVQSDGIIEIHSTAVKTPFSFFNRIYVPAQVAGNKNDPDYVQMIAHERAHVRGRHSWDIIAIESLCILFWFHPLVYWYRNALRTVHEYLADAEASRTHSIKQYGLLLIRQAQSGMSPALVNHFFQSPLKQRLIMLTKKHSTPAKALSFALVIPMIALFVLLFQQTPSLAQTSDVAPEYPGGQAALIKFLSENIQYPAEAKKQKIEGNVVLQFVINKDGSIKDVENLKPEIHPLLVEEAIRVVKLMPKWKPGLKDNKVAKVKYALPIRFKLE